MWDNSITKSRRANRSSRYHRFTDAFLPISNLWDPSVETPRGAKGQGDLNPSLVNKTCSFYRKLYKVFHTPNIHSFIHGINFRYHLIKEYRLEFMQENRKKKKELKTEDNNFQFEICSLCICWKLKASFSKVGRETSSFDQLQILIFFLSCFLFLFLFL